MSGVTEYLNLTQNTIELFDMGAHLLGFIGMVCVVIAFWFVVSERWKPTSLAYNCLNGIGAILLILSLCVHFNLGSFVIEIFWISISILGIYKNLKKAKQATTLV